MVLIGFGSILMAATGKGIEPRSASYTLLAGWLEASGETVSCAVSVEVPRL